MPHRRLPAALMLLLGPVPVPALLAQSSFLLRRDADTVSVERFSRSETRLESELLVRAANARFRFEATLDGNGLVQVLRNRYWLATDTVGAAPRQSAALTFQGDSVIAEITAPAAAPVVRRLGSRAGALPNINPSFALMELFLARARRAGVAEVPMFLVQGGQTVPALISWAGDSATLQVAGSEMRVAVGREGRILGGRIPSQNLVIERLEGAPPALLATTRPDYSAPPGAPYAAADVTVPTPMGHTLAGTLTLPRGAGAANRVPAVVTITGSGAQDRDEHLPFGKGYRPFREIADALARGGIAVLRMDDRGYGGSGGDPNGTTADFAQDIRAGLAYLRTRAEIDSRRLALLGHSEGGVIAPLVALEEPDLAGLVLLAGTARPGRSILEFQLRNLTMQDTAYRGARRDSALAAIPARIDSMASQPWLNFFLQYDPAATARRVTTPVLVLNGATDQQVTPDQVPELVAAFKQAGNRDVTSHVFPDLNHLFVRDPDGFPGRYATLPDLTVDPAVIGMVRDWLAKRLSIR